MRQRYAKALVYFITIAAVMLALAFAFIKQGSI